MKVSVAIATYNRAPYIRQAIDSVLNQTMTDFEIIVVDDGSTDNTVEVIADYRDRIRYVRTANGGPARARNVGMAMARGEYICWLDSDDFFHPAKLALQSAVLDAHPDVAMVCTECSGFDDHGAWYEYHLQDYHASAYRRGGVAYDDLFDRKTAIGQVGALRATLPDGSDWGSRKLYLGRIFDRYLMNTVVFTNSMLFRRAAFAEIGPQRPRFGFFHDLEFALRLTRARQTAFLDVPTYAIRYHPDQISTRVGPRAPWIMIRKQQDLLRVLRVHGMRDRSYYLAHKALVDRQCSRLCRAVAIPMLGYVSGSAHHSRYVPQRARIYLRHAARLGHPHRLLMLASRLPQLPRRLVMKLESLLRGLQARWHK
jgi:glycosyltransferase involved in cell wall biosynthesis